MSGKHTPTCGERPAAAVGVVGRLKSSLLPPFFQTASVAADGAVILCGRLAIMVRLDKRENDEDCCLF
ncbi:hypothetical protein [Neisseria dumasiana]|uniref:hypothetical protein n=1 Tax=Neisseria dumasiana TaxID=1931275 RepID=UPI0015D72136|nr:hypothetical protein [Neisseria dumasiana]